MTTRPRLHIAMYNFGHSTLLIVAVTDNGEVTVNPLLGAPPAKYEVA